MRQRLLDAFKAHAADSYPRECCALLVRAGRRELYLRCDNTAERPEEEFRIAPEAYAAAEDRGEIIGVCHSHPDATARPSPRDTAMCNESGVPWHILSWPEGDLRTITPADAPLVGRPFVHGTDFDCYGLIRDWYRRERGVELPRYPHDRYWWELGENLYLDHYREAGFRVVIEGEPTTDDMRGLQVGDVILMQVQSPQVNHGAIYLGENRILHHLFGQLSRPDVYGPGGYWSERTRLVVRYRQAAYRE